MQHVATTPPSSCHPALQWFIGVLCVHVVPCVLQSGVFAQQGAPAGRIPFLDWLDYQAAYAAATAAAAEGAVDGPAAKRRRVSEMSGTQGPPAPAAAAGRHARTCWL